MHIYKKLDSSDSIGDKQYVEGFPNATPKFANFRITALQRV